MKRSGRHVGDDVDVIAQQAGDLGTRMRRAFEDLFRFGAAHVVLIGSDLPTLPGRRIVSAITALRERGDRIVLGPAVDGGYYLIGMKALHPEIFRDVAWGTPRVLQETLERARQTRLEVHLLEPWHDVDDWADLETLRDSPGGEGGRTRALLEALGNVNGISASPHRRLESVAAPDPCPVTGRPITRPPLLLGVTRFRDPFVMARAIL